MLVLKMQVTINFVQKHSVLHAIEQKCNLTLATSPTC